MQCIVSWHCMFCQPKLLGLLERCTGRLLLVKAHNPREILFCASVATDVDPGLAQDRDSLETVTNGRDVNGNGQNTCTNVLWNNQYALLVDENDGN